MDPRGRPVADAAVALVQFGVSGVPNLRSHTDANGEFRLPAPPGTYGLTATHANWAAAYVPKLEIREGASIIPAVNLQAGGYLLEGRVVLGRGVEAGRVRLALARLSNDAGDIFLVDLHEGAFKVRLPQGSYIVIAEGAAIRSVNRKLPSGCASIGRAPAQGFFDNGLNRAATGDAWTRIVIEGPVAEDADTVTVGAMCSGAGSGGFDGVTLDVVD